MPIEREDAWLRSHDGFVAEARKLGIDVLFLGDSITDFWRETNPRQAGVRYGTVSSRRFTPRTSALPVTARSIWSGASSTAKWRILLRRSWWC